MAAKDLDTGKAQTITITSAQGLSDDAINAAINDAEKYKAEDDQIRETAEVKTRAQTMLRRADLALKNLDKTRKADKAQVKEARKALKKAMLKKDTDALAQASRQATLIHPTPAVRFSRKSHLLARENPQRDPIHPTE